MNSATEYESLLAQTEESLRWLSECGVDSIAVPQGWQIPRLMPSQLTVNLPSDEPATVDVIGETSGTPPKLSRLLDELGSSKVSASQRVRGSFEQAPEA